MQWLAALCVNRPVFATVLILSLTVVGAFSFTQLGVDRFPKVDFPTVVVTTVQPGAAPEQIETEITDKIEEAVNTISGIDELRSISSEGVSHVIVGFLLDKNVDVAAQEVRDKVNGVLPLLPRTIEQPRVDKFDPDAAPVLSIALTRQQAGPRRHRVRRQGAAPPARERQRRRPGARPRRPPAPDQRLARRRSPARLQPDGHRRLARAAGAEHRDSRAAASTRAPQSVTLRTRGRVQTVAEFNDIVVREQDGHPVRVGDVAQRRGRRGRAARRSPTSTAPATVLLQVRRQSGTNTVEVVDGGQGAARRGQGDAAARLRRCASSATCPSSSRRRSTTSRST